MVNKLHTSAGEAVSSDSVHDLEDAINTAHNATLAADVVVDSTVSGHMSDDQMNAAVHAVKNARDAVRTAHSAFHAFFDQMRVAAAEPACDTRVVSGEGAAKISQFTLDDIVGDLSVRADICCTLSTMVAKNLAAMKAREKFTFPTAIAELEFDQLHHQVYEVSRNVRELIDEIEGAA